MKFKKGNKVYNLAEAIFEYCKTAECSFCSICDAVKYTCGNEAKDLADLMGFEVIDEPTIGEIVAKHSEDDTTTIAETATKHSEDANPMDEIAKYAEEYIEAKKRDNVNHPAHYTSGGIEYINAMQAAFGDEAVKNFFLCDAFKRAKRKGGEGQTWIDGV
jgi:hypothetical protein